MYKDYVENQMPNRFVHEDDNGFLTYSFVDTGCILEEIYVKPEARRKGVASGYYKEVEKIAKDCNCAYLRGFILVGIKDSNESLLCLLKNGYKIESVHDNKLIYLIKEIGE
jgi:GNAT superfamily N-acetyltransferase